jgi:hypothetical protein
MQPARYRGPKLASAPEKGARTPSRSFPDPRPPVEELPPQAESKIAMSNGRDIREAKWNVFTAGPPSKLDVIVDIIDDNWRVGKMTSR